MADAFVDSSVLIGLVFRHAGERAACQAALPNDGEAICSRYLLFEVARGFLRNLIVLHNASFEFHSFADLHQAAYSGQQRFKPYRMHTWLPDDECGRPTACRLQAFIEARKTQSEAIAAELEALPDSRKDTETAARIHGLRHLLSIPRGARFDGTKCHRCGDALICLEAPEDSVIVTKNRKHFEPLAHVLGKQLAVVDSARSTD